MCEATILSALGKILDWLRAAGAQWELVASTPKPVFLIEWDGEWSDRSLSTPLMFLSYALGELLTGSKICSIMRCVGIERLALILQQGCDVQPKDSVLWIDKSPSKALEYGGDQKVMMVFDIKRTQASYQEAASNTDQNTLDKLRAAYPTVVPSIDGSRLWFSRLPEHDRRVTSAYEIEHGRWIPEDPIEALAGLLVLGRELAALREAVKSIITACQHPQWK